MNPGQTSQTLVKSATRTLDLIEYVVARPDGVAAQEIAVALAIPVSSLSYLLATLVEATYLRREGRRYCAGPGLDRLRRPSEERSLVDRSRPLIKALRLQLDETASLFELDGWELEVSATETSKQTLRYALDVGQRVPLHCVAAGKAVLAALDADRLHRYLAEAPRERFTAGTICATQDLMAELAAVATQGYALARDEYTAGLCAVGVAIRLSGRPVAAVSIAVPSPRFTPAIEAAAIARVVKTGQAIERLY